ncbi:nostrin isoform X2 [Ambystoma mexicanum]|uniref:nostrin isoform X2 n=1 Tax=Ambystoma mexicanum TaxID=8296 RepID=UPI0037E7B4A1
MKDPLAGCTYDRVYRELKEFSKNGEAFCKQLMSVLQQRFDLEIRYAKGLHKTANKLTRALENMKKNCIYDAFACVSEEMCSTGDLHQKLGMAIQLEAIKPTVQILEEHDKKRKCLDNEVEKTTGPVLNNWKQQIKIKKKLMDHTRQHEACFHTVNNSRKSAGEKEKQKLLDKLKKSAEILTKKDDDYYRENIEGLATRLRWETSLENWYQSIQELEKERIQLLCNILKRYNEHVSNFGQTLAMCHQQIDNAISKVDVEKDIKNFMEETSLSSEENKSEYLLTDYFEEDLTNGIDQERRTQSLNMKLERLHNDIEKASRDKDGLAKMLKAARENPCFSDAKNQEDTVLLLDETKLKLCLLEANFYKLSTAVAEIEKKPGPSHPCSNCIYTWEEKGCRHAALLVSRPIRMKRLERSVSVVSTGRAADTSNSQRHSKRTPMQYSPADNGRTTQSMVSMGDEAASASIGDSFEDISQTDRASDASTSSCRAAYTYTAENEDELSFNKGASDASTSSCRAAYTYTAQREDELSFNKGDAVVVHHRNEDGWWYGTSNKKKGYFPSSYLEECSLFKEDAGSEA